MTRSEQDGYDGFLSRWSRRKTESRADQPVEQPLVDADDQLEQDLNETLKQSNAANRDAVIADDNDSAMVVPEQDAMADPARDPEQAPEPLPDIDTLTEESDFKPFMAPNVTKEIRNLALRKLFKAAVFGHRDGLDDYDEDFTTFEPLGDTITADMRHHAKRREELARKAREEQEHLAQGGGDEAVEDDIEDASTRNDEDTEILAQNDPDDDNVVRHTLKTPDDGALTDEPIALTGKLRRKHDSADPNESEQA